MLDREQWKDWDSWSEYEKAGWLASGLQNDDELFNVVWERAVLQRSNVIPSLEIALAYICHGTKCFYCGAPATSLDHVRPRSRRGRHRAYNLVPACASCNSAKRDRDLEEFRLLRAKQADGRPQFTEAQLAYLARKGITLPALPHFIFYGERRS